MFIYRHRRPTKLNCLSSLLSTLLLRKWLRAVFQIKVVHQPFYISICISGLSMQHTTGVNNAQMFMMMNPEYCIQRRIRPPPPLVATAINFMPWQLKASLPLHRALSLPEVLNSRLRFIRSTGFPRNVPNTALLKVFNFDYFVYMYFRIFL